MAHQRNILGTLLAALGLAAQAAALQPGTPAPPFSARDQAGHTVTLEEFRGHSVVVLYFYPKDDTPGCTREACSLRDGFQEIRDTGAVILGVSADDVASHAAFALKLHLPFPLLADPDHTIIKAYGAGRPLLGIARRITFIIGPDGIIRDVIQDVQAAEHDRQVLERLRARKITP